jgi:hypothetical protein
MRSLPDRLLRAAFLSLSTSAFLAGCDAFDGSRSEAPDEESESAQGDLGAGSVIHEPAQGGRARALALVDARWGVRVDLWGRDSADGTPRPWLSGVVVGPDLEGVVGIAARDVFLPNHRERLVLSHAPGSDGALQVLRELERGLVPLEAGPVPAGAAIALRFDDLLDPRGVAAGLGVVLDGASVVGARAEPDTAHGVALAGVHHSARLTLELPAGSTTSTRSLQLDLGGLANLDGRTLGADAVVSAALGGEALSAGVPPFVVGRLDGQLTSVVAGAVPGFYLVEFQFEAQACAFAPQVGDILSTATHQAHVIAAGAPPQGASTGRLRVQLVGGDPATFAPAAAQLRARWDPALGAPPACFVRIAPKPGSAPAGDVATDATFTIEFSVPMLPGSVQSTGTWTLAHADSASALTGSVPAQIVPDALGVRYTLVPVLPLAHRQGSSERYLLRLADGPAGVTDPLLTPLEQALPEIELALAAAQPTVHSGGLSYTFGGLDEDGDGLPDLRGQGFFDLSKGLVGGRPVMRFSEVADDSQTMIAAMPLLAQGVKVPLEPLGARQMSLWRYIDLGFGLLDDLHHNLDVEGLSWAPSQAVLADRFSEFRMALAHSFFLPDEVLDLGLLPKYRLSGLEANYDKNVLDGLAVVHDKAQGYTIDPADGFVGSTGTLLQPWPLNRNVPLSQFQYWTWRDTAVLEVGGPTAGTPNSFGVGADPERLEQVTGTPALVGFYPKGKIPTIAEPLLMEFRTYPDAGALGANALKASFAINSSYKPTFRAFSAGGVDAQGQTHLVDPDAAVVASGGFTAGGQMTGPIDNTVHWGQADFVTRVSRSHTRWLDTGTAHDFVAAVVEYAPFGLPIGTQVELAYRGASSVSASAGAPWLDAGLYDPYGDGYTQAQLDMLFGAGAKPSFQVVEFPVDGDKSWHDSIDDLDGARWIQVRLTFVANVRTNVAPQVAGIAVAYQ